MTVMLTFPEMERLHWYLAHDFQSFKHMGLVHGPNDPWGKYTPSAVSPAYANLIHRLHGAKFVEKVGADPRTRAFRFDRDGQSTWVCWSLAGTPQITFTTAGNLTLVNAVGGENLARQTLGTALRVFFGQCIFVDIRGMHFKRNPSVAQQFLTARRGGGED